MVLLNGSQSNERDKYTPKSSSIRLLLLSLFCLLCSVFGSLVGIRIVASVGARCMVTIVAA